MFSKFSGSCREEKGTVKIFCGSLGENVMSLKFFRIRWEKKGVLKILRESLGKMVMTLKFFGHRWKKR
jgi:hypothetical protein